jgi:Tol biopolymer transport system component
MNKIGFIFFIICCYWVVPASSEWSDPINLGSNINRAVWSLEYYPCISSDGTKLYYTTGDRPGGYGDDDIWISTWEDTIWGVPLNAGPNVNSNNRDLSPSISSDGTKLYFVSWGRPGGYGSYDIWVSTWEDTMWGPIVNVGSNINTPFMEWNVSITFDSTKLYFSSNRPGGFGDVDLWVSEWDSINSEWSPASNLGMTVNTSSEESSPALSSDGTKLYFSRWWGVGLLDIYVSDWQDTIWSPAVNLGPPVNTNMWDNGPSISSDGMRLYFASGRGGDFPADQDLWVSEWVTGVEEESDFRFKIADYRLMQNVPNPTISTALIRYSLSTTGNVRLKVYDITGKLVRTLVDGKQKVGNYEIKWDGRNERGEEVRSGIYFYRLSMDDFREIQKMIMIR